MQTADIGGIHGWLAYQHLRRHFDRQSGIAGADGNPALRAMRDRRAAQARQTAAAADNAANMVDYTRTRDAWAQQVQNIQIRMGELATMANDGTKSAADRQNLQVEFAQMQKEIQRITSGPDAAARYNGLFLFQA